MHGYELPMSNYHVDAVSSVPVRPLVKRSPELPHAARPRVAVAIVGFVRRFALRFGVLYVALYVLGEIIGMIPAMSNWLSEPYSRMWRSFIPWFGKNVLLLDEPISVQQTGSGDKLYDWAQVAAMLVCSAVGASVWVWFDRARKTDRISAELVRIALRYSLGATMLSYGTSKLLWLQTTQPGFYRLLGTYGESSPMGMLWAFMGHSYVYCAFAGGMEFLGGFLLFFRRTTTLGAFLLIAVMTNVALLNFCFDVPVKLFSTHLLMFAVILAWRDLGRMLKLFFLHRPTAPSDIVRPWPLGPAGRLMSIAKALMVAWILWTIPVAEVWSWAEQPAPEKNPLYGLYEVDTFSLNGTERPPLVTDTMRWRRVGIEETRFGRRFIVVMMDDKRHVFRFRFGSQAGKIALRTGGPRAEWNDLIYTQPSAGTLSLEGRIDSQDLVIQLRRADENKMLLVNRGFHWISERPHNR